MFTDGSFLSCDAVIIATAAPLAADMLGLSNPALAATLRKITYASPVVIHLLYERMDLRRSLDGAGFLVPRNQNRLMRACTFSSNKFPFRVTPSKVLLRVSANTRLFPEIATFSDNLLKETAVEELNCFLGIESKPKISIVFRHQNAIAQYAPGHDQLKEKIDHLAGNTPGLVLIGNAYQGVGIADCIQYARLKTERLISSLQNLSQESKMLNGVRGFLV